MVITPDLSDLKYKEIKGIKYFELVAEEVEREILPGLFIKAWGYNGTTPGPTIKVHPGDYVNFRVYNNLSEPTSIHWHGLDVPNIMDGVPDVQPSPKVEPGKYFDYRFKIINPPGTHMYHTHHISHKQQMMGLEGGLIVLDPYSQVDKDYFIMLQEFKVEGLEMGEVKKGKYGIDPLSHDFNFFTMNGRCFPFVTPLEVSCGQTVRIRLGNTMENGHPIHIHGHQLYVSASDGNIIHPFNRIKKSTIHVSSGETYDVEFFANNPGIWPFHCHIPHHMSNNMTDPTGGMFTTIVYK
ncbi:multicopper oxidase domain-containing protein [Clostridium sporogenes]|jgi:FtsP/CotA-like multicopper oxidase with cupredoxin domain|uniref:Multicopper oxidase n=2 Tax=Clostridium TaxID=1485 RepID=A0A0D1BW60_CLOBO|nr:MULTISPECIES: multicopper oxidase domain-containing protein [Clostridium]MDU2833450.1 multicopper oxidase domain-containing protein [Clostridium botulinum]EDU38903.1 multicopper oxidase [Clostridium sporogenes ATCC 15579]KIS23031.1 multicopper oxidase [Clostridium botulinum B2 450]MCW6095179.1 multicopper oxidase domain-containing protein [Clostridium sporogenes]MDU4545697.1 multicopper oxidase domain-containing protein [Clostridium botulinum]